MKPPTLRGPSDSGTRSGGHGVGDEPGVAKNQRGHGKLFDWIESHESRANGAQRAGFPAGTETASDGDPVNRHPGRRSEES